MNNQQINNLLDGILEHVNEINAQILNLTAAENESNNSYAENGTLLMEAMARQARGEDVTAELERLNTNLTDLARERSNIFTNITQLNQLQLEENRRYRDIANMQLRIEQDRQDLRLDPQNEFRRETLEADKARLMTLVGKLNQDNIDTRSDTDKKLNEDLTHLMDKPEDSKKLLDERLEKYKETKNATENNQSEQEQTNSNDESKQEETNKESKQEEEQKESRFKKIINKAKNFKLTKKSWGKIALLLAAAGALTTGISMLFQANVLGGISLAEAGIIGVMGSQVFGKGKK